MQHSQRLDQKLHTLREEVRTMAQEKERGEQVWRERLQRCQRQLKAKEDEMSRQSQYFETFKTQLQQKLSLARDREQTLQKRIYTLEKQLLEMTVSAATGMTGNCAVRITAGTVTRWEEQERLPPMRGEGEGEEERKEEKKKQWQPSDGKTEKKIQENQNSNEIRLQGFILSLKEDLQVLLEREEHGMTQRKGLMEQLQGAQEKSHFLGCTVEEMKVEVNRLKRSESFLLEEVEELREENHRLLQVIRDAANQTSCQSFSVPESTCLDPGTSSPSCSPADCPVPSSILHPSGWSSEEVNLTAKGDNSPPNSPAVAHFHHQATAKCTQTATEDHSSFAKSDTSPKNDVLKHFSHIGSKTDPSLQSLSLTTETGDEFKIGTWCSRGILNLEESPSEESDALREAYRSLGFGDDLEALKEQRDRLEVALQHTQEQLQVMTQENTQLKIKLRKEEDEQEAEESSKEKINTLLSRGGAESNTILALAQGDLVQALNQENRALADRIQQLLAHIELREDEIKTEETQLREHIYKLEADVARLEQENQEHGGLITELTKKTEDDLNTIMEMQQRLEESGQHTEESKVDKDLHGSQLQIENTAVLPGCFKLYDQEKCVEHLVESVLKEDEPKLMSNQHPDDSTTATVPQQINHCDLFQNRQQTISVQSLKTQQEELLDDINSLREQQKEVALSVKTQTEVKQQLTRTVWGLKEEKDSITQSLAGVRQEKEQLTRNVCGLRDERDQLIKSMSDLKEEKEQLAKCLSGLKSENKTLLESLLSGKEEKDQIMQSLLSLQTEREQLSQAVLDFKIERDGIMSSLKSLKEQRDREQSFYTLQEDQDRLKQSVSSLIEEKERIEQSVRCLKQEETQTKISLQGLREERNSLQAAHHSQTQTEGRNQKQLLMNTNSAVEKKTETVIGTGAEAHRGNPMQTQRLHNEMHQTEVRSEEDERKAAQAADDLMWLTDVANQMEDTRMENESLKTQVNELQRKLTGVVREKTNALSLKAQIDEQHNMLTAQLKAKTVALEELNSEYIALKRGQDSKEDVGTALVSLRTQYNDIRAKYEALLKKRTSKDLDIAPLKAKLSCLVVMCQERNSLLAQMMKTMNRRGFVDPVLTQQVEELLSDTVLQDYTATFTPGCKTRENSTGFTPGFLLKLQDYSSGFTPDQSCCTISPLVNQQVQNVCTTDSAGKYREIKSPEISSVAIKSSTSHRECSSEVSPAPTGTLKRDANSPVQEHASVKKTSSAVVSELKESLNTDKEKLCPPASGPIHATSATEIPEIKGKSSLELSRSTGSSLSTTALSRTRVSASRRLSSPEKILNLHEQLQTTMKSSYQGQVSRGRLQQPRKCLSFSPAADLRPASPTEKQSISFHKPDTNSHPVTTALSKAKSTSAVTATTVAKTTLYTAVTSRSAHVKFNPNMLTHHHFKAGVSKTATPALSSSSFIDPSRAESDSSSCTNTAKDPKPTKTNAAFTDISDAKHAASSPLTQRTTMVDSDVLICSDTNPKNTASDTTAQEVNHFNTPPETNGAAPAYDGPVFPASPTQSAPCSPVRTIKSTTKCTAAPEKTETTRLKPGVPAEVCSVKVIKTVGQSSLLIGWERPTLDELGCSNGTFVYGYRVLVDGDFHKSVMSSACTKCILENVNLSLPVQISVQTLGSNGLRSNSVHTLYRASGRTHHNSPD